MLIDNLEISCEIIKNHLHIGYAKWEVLIERLQKQINTKGGKQGFKDEQLWTFLLGCGYAMDGANGVRLLSEILTGVQLNAPDSGKIWFEVLPIPPRKYEGNTHLDLALGTISCRKPANNSKVYTQSGIQLDKSEDSWICFCEMKWDSDISTTVSNDLKRTQLIRVIENALCFQDNRGNYADSVYVTLVTPSMFYLDEYKSRLYQYKYEEYTQDKKILLKDLEACILDKNKYKNWRYPDNIEERIDCLKINWVTYEQLFDRLPQTVLTKELKEFRMNFGK